MSAVPLRRKCPALRRGRVVDVALEGESRAKGKHSRLLHWFEEVAQLSGERLADNQALKNVVHQTTPDLQLVGPLIPRKAPLVPIMLIGSLELLVADESAIFMLGAWPVASSSRYGLPVAATTSRA